MIYKEVFMGFIFIPLIPAFILFLMGILKRSKRKNWKKTDAISIKDSSLGFSFPKPIVEYDVDGVTYREQSNVGQRFHIRPGKKVQVFYNPERPNEMIIDTFIQRGSVYFLIGGVFLFFSFTSTILYFITSFLHSLIEFPPS